MAKKTVSKPKKPAQTTSDKDRIPVEHALLKKAGPDDLLLTAYAKVERKLAGQLNDQLSALLGGEIEMKVRDSEKAVFIDWLERQDENSVYLQYQFGAFDQPILVRINRLFLTAAVDCFYGGDFEALIATTGDLRRSEISMIEKIGEIIAISLSQSWLTLLEIPVRFVSYLQDKSEVEMELDDDHALILSASIELPQGTTPTIDIVQSIDALVAVEPQFNRPLSREVNEIDPVWREDLKHSVHQVYLPVRSVLARPTMDLSQLSRLTVGDVLPVAPTDNVPLIVGDRVFAYGTVGEQNGGVAFKIKQFL